MNQDSEESSISENKNLTEYEKVWEEIRTKINVTAKEYIPILYDALIKDGYTPKEAREKIKKDAFNIWAEKTIDDYIPVEAKQEIKVLAGQLGQEKKQENKLLQRTEAGQRSISETKPKSAPVQKPTNIVKIKLSYEDCRQIKASRILGGISFSYDLDRMKTIDLC